MASEVPRPVTVSRRIAAPADVVFAVLSDPSRHTEIDGTDMLRGAASEGLISGVGDVFIMKMSFSRLGDYEMNNHVVEFEQGRRIGWEPAPGKGHPADGKPGSGHRWSYELVPDGPDAVVVTEIFDCSRAPEALRVAIDNGNQWVSGMTATLARLDMACAEGSASATAGAS